MDKPRRILASTQTGETGMFDDRSQLSVESKNPGITITLRRNMLNGELLKIMLSVPEAASLVAALAAAIESEANNQKDDWERQRFLD